LLYFVQFRTPLAILSEVAFRPDTPLNTLKNGPYVALLYVMGTYDFSLVSTFTIRFRFWIDNELSPSNWVLKLRTTRLSDAASTPCYTSRIEYNLSVRFRSDTLSDAIVSDNCDNHSASIFFIESLYPCVDSSSNTLCMSGKSIA
jgi:hypothetical protein